MGGEYEEVLGGRETRELLAARLVKAAKAAEDGCTPDVAVPSGGRQGTAKTAQHSRERRVTAAQQTTSCDDHEHDSSGGIFPFTIYYFLVI